MKSNSRAIFEELNMVEFIFSRVILEYTIDIDKSEAQQETLNQLKKLFPFKDCEHKYLLYFNKTHVCEKCGEVFKDKKSLNSFEKTAS